MKLIIFLFLLIIFSCHAVNVSVTTWDVFRQIFKKNDNKPETSNGARVLLNVKMPEEEPYLPQDADIKCLQPREISRIFKNCRPSGDQSFPSKVAVCDCSNCELTLQLKCNKDKIWYSDYPHSCSDLGTIERRCGNKKCTIEQLPEGIQCDYNNNTKNEIKKCYCKNNCQEVRLNCSETGWKLQNENVCFNGDYSCFDNVTPRETISTKFCENETEPDCSNFTDSDSTLSRLEITLICIIPVAILIGVLLTLSFICYKKLSSNNSKKQNDRNIVHEVPNRQQIFENIPKNSCENPEYLEVLDENVYETLPETAQSLQYDYMDQRNVQTENQNGEYMDMKAGSAALKKTAFNEYQNCSFVKNV